MMRPSRERHGLAGLFQRSPGVVWIVFFGLSVVLAAWLVALKMTARDLELEMRRINGENTALARVLEEHVARAIKLSDNALLFLKREYETHGTTTGKMADFVAEARQDPLLNQVGLVNSRGDLILSAVPLVRPVNIAHRDHFRVHAASDTVGLFVAKPLLSMVSGAWSIFLTRRLNGPDGSFAGVVSAGIDPHYFSDYFAAPELGADRAILLVGTDGIIRARRFQQQSDVGQDISASPLFKLLQTSGVGSYEVTSLLDGLPKIASFHRVPGTSLVVVVTEIKQAALAGFQQRKRAYAAGALFFTLFTAGFCFLLIRSVRLAGLQNARLAAELAERRQVEDALQKSRAFVESILDAVDDGFLVVDKDLRVITANQAFCRQTNQALDEVLGLSCHAVAHPALVCCRELEEECPVKATFETGLPRVALRQRGGMSGREKAFEIKSFPLNDSAGRVQSVILTLRDITGKLLMEEQLSNAQRLESVGILAGGIAHDFNNLLGVILGNVSFAKMLLPADTQPAVLLQRAEEACEHATDLTSRLLVFAKGGAPLKKTLRLQKTLRDTVGMALSGSSVSAVFDVADDLRAVDADEGQMRQVFSNLTINAGEAMADGGAVEVGAENWQVPPGALPPLPAGWYVKISFRDHGRGIPRQIVDRVFDPYFSTKEMGNRKGQGLGLTICDSIVKKHQGLITVATEPGEGALFTIYLPVSEHASEEPAGAVVREESGARGGEKILVMDDDAGVRDMLGRMLNHLGHAADLLADSAGTVQAYREALAAGAPYTLVILDLTIQGGKGGAETFRELQGLDPRVRAIISSGYAENPILVHYREHGFVGAMAKPYTVEQLKKVLASSRQPVPADG